MSEEAPTPDVDPQGQVQVQIPEHHFEILYTDQAFVSHSPVGFTVDFAQLTPQAAVSRVVARVGMSATHLKLLVKALGDNLAQYEQRYGTVAVTAEMMEQHAHPTHHIGFQPTPGRRAGEGEHEPRPVPGDAPPSAR